MKMLWVDVAVNELALLNMEKESLLEGLKDEKSEVVKIGFWIRLDLLEAATIRLEERIQRVLNDRDINEILTSNLVTIQPLKSEQ